MIKGSRLIDAIISGEENIKKHCDEVNELNVFPVPDGDTGTNLSLTMEASAKELQALEKDADADEVLEKSAYAMLRGARGNSGVILSLIFRGMANAVKGKNELTSTDILNALKEGTVSAYGSVSKPEEGTMLTVIRKCGEKAEEYLRENEIISPEELWEKLCIYAGETVEQTPEMLPVLKQAGVVDSGGKGLFYIFEGMKNSLMNISPKNIPVKEKNIEKKNKKQDKSDIEFSYCTEFIIRKNNNKSSSFLNDYLCGIGDSVVVVDDKDIIKIHAHTNEPHLALQTGLSYGELTDIKIENMRLQNENFIGNKTERKKYGFVCVVCGEGLEKIFREIGADKIVTGGQTMNPSTEEILEAVNSLDAECIFILPNNKNVMLCAQQVKNLTDKKVEVICTENIPQGINAMINFDEDLKPDENIDKIVSSLQNVKTGFVTYASRESTVNGKTIKKGEILAMGNGLVYDMEKTPEKACMKVAEKLVEGENPSFITVYRGRDADEKESELLCEELKKKYSSDTDVNVVYGGQPIYYYIISVEKYGE